MQDIFLHLKIVLYPDKHTKLEVFNFGKTGIEQSLAFPVLCALILYIFIKHILETNKNAGGEKDTTTANNLILKEQKW